MCVIRCLCGGKSVVRARWDIIYVDSSEPGWWLIDSPLHITYWSLNEVIYVAFVLQLYLQCDLKNAFLLGHTVDVLQSMPQKYTDSICLMEANLLDSLSTSVHMKYTLVCASTLANIESQ